VSFARDIRPLFREKHVNSMVKARWFDVSNHSDVASRAEHILGRLTVGDMPCDGSWLQDQVDLFAEWIADGKQA
jgi:hypothetical protein